MSLRTSPPAEDEYGAPYAGYIRRVPPGQDIVEVLARQRDETLARFRSVPETRGAHRYAPGKWSVKELVAHLSDTERIMAYRALRVGRGDATPLPGFDEQAYAPRSGADAQSLGALVAEWGDIRQATLALFRHFPPEAWARRGTASDSPVSVRALAWIIAGHERHHLATLAERYGLWATPAAARPEAR
jgi:DinB superfamily